MPDGGADRILEVTVEIPSGSRNKYEYDHERHRFVLDRVLYSSVHYPCDYGFIDGTLAEDGDPLDVLVLLDEPTFPGCHIHARPVAVFWMQDEAGPDAKVLCVPSTDPRQAAITDLDSLPGYLLDEIGHFFDVYKALEPGKGTETRGWQGREAAEAAVEDARRRYKAE